MEDKETPSHPSKLVYKPLMISMIGIVSTALAILLYNFIMTRYCARRQGVISRPGQQSNEKGTGVEQKVLDSIPIIAYTYDEGGIFREDQTECAVCLGEFNEGEVVRLLPNCRHAFHVHCIDDWFFSHSNCPVCRSQIVASVTCSELSVSLEAAVVESSESNEHAHVAIASIPRAETGSSRILKRSISLDYSYVTIMIQRDAERDSSSTMNALLLRSESHKVGSSKRLEHASSLTKSFSRFRSTQSDTASRIFPC